MDKQCPHIISSDEGTSYCSLAGKTAEHIKELEQRLAELHSSARGLMWQDLTDLRELWLDAVDNWGSLGDSCLNMYSVLEKYSPDGTINGVVDENRQLREQLQQAQDANSKLTNVANKAINYDLDCNDPLAASAIRQWLKEVLVSINEESNNGNE